MRNKEQITQAILEQLPEEVRLGFKDLDDAIMYFWMNIRNDSGLRLTLNGYNILTKILKMTGYEVDINPDHITKRTILQLDRQLSAPYYISVKKAGAPKIVLFSSREAMMASLYGDVRSWLERGQ